MDMKSLFNDFKNYVDAMDIQAVKKNIQEAVVYANLNLGHMAH